MIPALIDLHVRPTLNEHGLPDVELLAVQARDHGLDGVAVVGRDEALDLGDTGSTRRATGVHLFTGVEVQTDCGALVCYPRALDAWFRTAGWQALPRLEDVQGAPYAAAAIIRAFAERGGAVVAWPGASGGGALPSGLTGIVVAAPELDDRAIAAAVGARIACIGASGAALGEAAFGCTATVFAAPPSSQEALVDGLRSGRVWPAEIGASVIAALVAARVAPQQQSARKPEPRPAQPVPQVHGGQPAPASQPAPTAHADSLSPARAAVAEAMPRGAKVKPLPGPKSRVKADPFERPGDNRGNRLNRDDVRRKVMPLQDDIQPAFDPVATMYGLDGRKIHRFTNKTDAEIDRINGNRAKGPDPNVMSMPLFDELRQERQHINLLFATTAEEDDLEDSVSLRFALSNMQLQDGVMPNRDLPSAAQTKRNGRRRRR